MTSLRLTLALLLALVLAPSSALGATKDVIRDCQDGSISGKYSQKDFNDALRNIPTDVDEYTDCRDVIRRAQLGSAGGSAGGAAAGAGGGANTSGGVPVVPAGGGTGGGSSDALLAAASPAEQKAVREATGGGGTVPVAIAGRLISPKAQGLSPAGSANVVPTPLIVALALLGAGLLVPLVRSGRTQLVPAIRGVRARVGARRAGTA